MMWEEQMKEGAGPRKTQERSIQVQQEALDGVRRAVVSRMSHPLQTVVDTTVLPTLKCLFSQQWGPSGRECWWLTTPR